MLVLYTTILLFWLIFVLPYTHCTDCCYMKGLLFYYCLFFVSKNHNKNKNVKC